jgi:hypothetical protein
MAADLLVFKKFYVAHEGLLSQQNKVFVFNDKIFSMFVLIKLAENNASKKIQFAHSKTAIAIKAFCATQTEEKLQRDKVKGKHNANKTHFEVGKKVRQTIEELGGTMPEDLPVTESIKKIENKRK